MVLLGWEWDGGRKAGSTLEPQERRGGMSFRGELVQCVTLDESHLEDGLAPGHLAGEWQSSELLLLYFFVPTIP